MTLRAVVLVCLVHALTACPEPKPAPPDAQQDVAVDAHADAQSDGVGDAATDAPDDQELPPADRCAQPLSESLFPGALDADGDFIVAPEAFALAIVSVSPETNQIRLVNRGAKSIDALPLTLFSNDDCQTTTLSLGPFQAATIDLMLRPDADFVLVAASMPVLYLEYGAEQSVPFRDRLWSNSPLATPAAGEHIVPSTAIPVSRATSADSYAVDAVSSGTTIRGRIMTVTGFPLPFATVEVTCTDWPDAQPLASHYDAAFMGAFPSGQEVCWVRVQAPGYLPSVRPFLASIGDVDVGVLYVRRKSGQPGTRTEPDTVVFDDGVTLQALPADLDAAGAIRLTVVPAAACPIESLEPTALRGGIYLEADVGPGFTFSSAARLSFPVDGTEIAPDISPGQHLFAPLWSAQTAVQLGLDPLVAGVYRREVGLTVLSVDSTGVLVAVGDARAMNRYLQQLQTVPAVGAPTDTADCPCVNINPQICDFQFGPPPTPQLVGVLQQEVDTKVRSLLVSAAGTSDEKDALAGKFARFLAQTEATAITTTCSSDKPEMMCFNQAGTRQWLEQVGNTVTLEVARNTGGSFSEAVVTAPPTEQWRRKTLNAIASLGSAPGPWKSTASIPLDQPIYAGCEIEVSTLLGLTCCEQTSVLGKIGNSTDTMPAPPLECPHPTDFGYSTPPIYAPLISILPPSDPDIATPANCDEVMPAADVFCSAEAQRLETDGYFATYCSNACAVLGVCNGKQAPAGVPHVSTLCSPSGGPGLVIACEISPACTCEVAELVAGDPAGNPGPPVDTGGLSQFTPEEMTTYNRKIRKKKQCEPTCGPLLPCLNCNCIDGNLIYTKLTTPECLPGDQTHSDPPTSRPGPVDAPVTGDPVTPGNGEFVESQVDLIVPGRGIAFKWLRRYKSRVFYEGPLGRNWDFGYNEFLRFRDADGDGDLDAQHVYLNADNLYRSTGSGALDWESPIGTFARLRSVDSGGAQTFELRHAHGQVHRFGPMDPLTQRARLTEIVDAAGTSSITFGYDATGRLTTIDDTLGRQYTVAYNGDGRIESLTDFAGRQVLYSYHPAGGFEGTEGDLASVRSPIITGTSNGNDFPSGRTTEYIYSVDPVHTALVGNLVAIRRPNEVDAVSFVPQVSITYGEDLDEPDEFDRVITVTRGGTNASFVGAGGTFQYYYRVLDGEAVLPTQIRRESLEVDRNGNLTAFRFGATGRMLERVEYTGQVPGGRNPQPEILLGPAVRAGFTVGPGINAPDPTAYTTSFSYDHHGQIIATTLPSIERDGVILEGETTEYHYAFCSSPNPLERGNMTGRRITAGAGRQTPGPGATVSRQTTFTYEPLFNKVVTATEPRGNHSSFDGPDPDDAPDGAAKYTARTHYDYQEMPRADVEALAGAWGIAISPFFPLALGDDNGDGEVGPAQGLLTRVLMPDATVLVWDEASQAIQFDVQSSSEIRRYNALGQVVTVVDDEENVTDYFYNPAADPHGLSGSGSFGEGGLLARVARDTTATSPSRNAGTNPPPENRAIDLRYDVYGKVIEMIDGSGVVTAMERNALGEVVRVVRAADVDAALRGTRPEESEVVAVAYWEEREYDANGNIIRVEVENRDSGTDIDVPGLAIVANPSWVSTRVYDLLDRMVTLTKEIDPATDAVWQFGYDANGNVVSVTEPDGDVVASSYDERDMLATVTDGAGSPVAATKSISYNHLGQVRYVVAPTDNDQDGHGDVAENIYDGWGRLVGSVDPAGQHTKYTYDVGSNMVSATRFGSPGGPTPSASDNPTLVRLTESRRTLDERGRIIRSDRYVFGDFVAGLETTEGPLTPSGGGEPDVTSLVEYDRLGRPIRSVDDNGNGQLRAYNGLHEVLLESAAAIGGQRSTVALSYDRSGEVWRRVETEVLPDGSTETYTFHDLWDAVGRRVMNIDPLGQASYAAHDSRGFETVVADAKGPLSASPDSLTGLVHNKPGNTTRRIADGLGRLLFSFQDLRLGGQGDGTPVFHPLNQPNPAVTPTGLAPTPENPDGVITQRAQWDAGGNMTDVFDDRGGHTQLLYDERDRMTVQVFADGSTYEVTYDADSNETVVTTPRGITWTTVFDVLGRPTMSTLSSTATMPPGTAMRISEYDGLNRTTRTFDNNDPDPAEVSVGHETVYHYDSVSNLLRQVQDGIEVAGQFDGKGRHLATRFPGGVRQLAFTRDALNRAHTVNLDVTGATAVDLCTMEFAGPAARVLTTTSGNGTQTRYAYDGKRRLTLTETVLPTPPAPPTLVVGRQYSYDRNDVRSVERWLEHELQPDVFKGRVYVSDSSDRLVEARGAEVDAQLNELVPTIAPPTWTWALDGAGNWVGATLPGLTLDFSPASGNAISATNGYSDFGYDASGNRTLDATRQYVYDGLERLVHVQDSAGTPLESYTYDAFDRRVTRTVHLPTPTMTRFVYDGPQVVEEHTDGAVVRNYYSPDAVDRIVARENADGTLYYFHVDVQGSTTALTDAAGQMVETYEYSPYGEVTIRDPGGQALAGSTVGNPYLYTGRRFDDVSGLYYFRDRFYDPQRGVFLARDGKRDPLGALNLYSYVGNSPHAYIDPWGLGGQKQGKGLFDRFVDTVGDVVDAGLAAGKGFVKGVASTVTDLAELPGAVIDATKALVDLGGAAKDLYKKFNELAGQLDSPEAVADMLKDLLTDLVDGLGDVMGELKGQLKEMMAWLQTPEGIGQVLGELAGGALLGLLTGGVGAAGKVAGKLAKALKMFSKVGKKVASMLRKAACKMKLVNNCFVVGTQVATGDGAVAIERVRVGQRVLSREDGSFEPPLAQMRHWRLIDVRIAPDRTLPTDVMHVQLLRSEAWLAAHMDESGRRVWVDLVDMDLEGWGDVVAVDLVPAVVEQGPGRVVTATVTHLNSDVYELWLEGAEESVEATGRHVFMSRDRGAWTALRDLREGERIVTRSGTPRRVRAVIRKLGVYPVVNLEVQGTHTYFVRSGRSWLLTHNTYNSRKGMVNSYSRNGRGNVEVNRGLKPKEKMNADHIPADNHMKNNPDAIADGYSKGKGVTMNLPHRLHVKGRTYGKKISDESARTSLALDIKYYRKEMTKAEYKRYRAGLKKVIGENKAKWPTTFEKKR